MKPTRLPAALSVALAFLVALPAARADEQVTVLTRNIYVGADIFRVIEVDPIFLVPEIAAVYQTVLDTNFPERAEALADEILAHQPALVGLQEVALIRKQTPGDFLFGNPEPATDIDFDFLAILMDAIANRGLNYAVAAVATNADVELPLITDILQDVRLTDRDVILVRGDIDWSNPLEANYQEFVALSVSGVPINFERGLTAVDFSVNGRNMRFVNTHMEVGGAFGAATQILQTTELIERLADEYRPTILVGDFNASPLSDPQQAYGQIVADGFIDTWLEQVNPGPGLTCCHNETLSNELPDLTSRIDHIFVRNVTTPAVTVLAADVLGDEVADKTPSGLWPSDHAGVVATLSLPDPDFDGDGFLDLVDNCITVVNTDQRDSNFDGFGNACDADFNQDNIVNLLDLVLFRQAYMGNQPDFDLDGDGLINLMDLLRFKALYFAPPGPAGISDFTARR